jgi:hypothetical protein
MSPVHIKGRVLTVSSEVKTRIPLGGLCSETATLAFSISKTHIFSFIKSKDKMNQAANNSTLPSNPFTDIKAQPLDGQINILLETVLDVCDMAIHYKMPETPLEMDAVLWRIRILAETTLARYNHIADNFSEF